MCSVNIAQAQTQVITDFPEEHFQVNRKNIINNGYYYFGNNRHRLIQNISGQTTAIWWVSDTSSPNPHSMLDMSKDFVFNFKLTFDSIGRLSDNHICDGFTFCMTTTPITPDLIGGIFMGEIGYTGIDSSFAVEFDTEHNNSPFEGGTNNEPFTPEGDHHTCYLRDGNMTAILDHNDSSTYKSMLPNWGSVRGLTICVTIIWRRTNGIDDYGGYDLITYINNLEKNNMHFATLDALITGLTQNEPYVNWGITSANSSPSEHIIEFLKLENGDINISSPRIIKIGAEGFSNDIFYVGSVSTMSTECGTIDILGSLNGADTTIVYGSLICYGDFFRIMLQGSSAGAEWSVLEDTGYVLVPNSNGSSYFPISYKNKDTAIVRLVINGDTIYFKFSFGNTPLRDYFHNISKSLGMSSSSNGAAMEGIVDTSSQSIPLPSELLDCIEISTDSSLFINQPSIVNGNLVFKIHPDKICDNISIILKNTCNEFCEKDSVIFNLYGVKLSLNKKITCDSLVYSLRNCGNGMILSHIGYELFNSADSNMSDSIIGGHTPFRITEAGSYKIICYNILTEAVLDSIELEVEEDDLELKLPFEIVSLGLLESYFESGNCEYAIELRIRADSLDNSFSLDSILKNYNFKLSYLNGDSSYLIDQNPSYDSTWDWKDPLNPQRNYFRKLFFITIECGEDGNNVEFADLEIFLSGEQVLCDDKRKSIDLPSCCSSNDCNNCLLLSVSPEPEMMYAHEPYKRQIKINIDPACGDKKIVAIETLYLLDNTTSSSSVNHQDSWSISVKPKCTGDKLDTARYRICVTFDDNSKCCEKVEFEYRCWEYIKLTDIISDPIVSTSALAAYVLDSVAVQVPPLDLHIDFYDNANNFIFNICNRPIYATNLEDSVIFDITGYPCGDYYAVFEIADETAVVPFTIGIISSAMVTPNPTSGLADVNYVLNCLPTLPMRISVKNIATGAELMLLYNDVLISLEGSIPIDVTPLITGEYLLVIEINDEVLQIPITTGITIIKDGN
jgi:hypothetical protein